MAVHHREGILCPHRFEDFTNDIGDVYWDAYIAGQTEWYHDIQKVTAEVGNHPLAGRIIEIAVNDGHALYLILGDKDGQPEIARLSIFDDYSIHPALIDGLSWDGVRELLGE